MIGSGGKARCRAWCAASILLGLVVAGGLVALLVLQPWSERPQASYPRAVVAANGVECATIGKEILERNGSAVDAAIATLFCEGVSCAQCMGLGGGFLATVYDSGTGRVRVLNARERAPAGATPGMFDNASSTVGGLAVAVPGELRGYGALHEAYGRLPWRQLVEPTAELCRKGHRVSEYMARVLQSYAEIIKAEPTMSEVYVNPSTGEVWREGDYVTHPTLAATLAIIAEEGPEALHAGSLAASLAADIRALGGIVTEEDLRDYTVEWQEPIVIPVSEDHTLYSVPLPGSGSVLAFIVNMLRGWAWPAAPAAATNLYWHRVVETFKYAYAKRTGLGDPSRPDLRDSILALEANLSNAEWAHSFRAQVDDSQTFSDWRHYGALFGGAQDHGTAHIVVVDADGSVASVTSTVNYIWGSQRRSQRLGFILNNEMDDFAIPNRQSTYGLPPSPANTLAPGLQPLSSMVPSIVLSSAGSPDLVIGAAGGTKITTQIALMVLDAMIEKEPLNEVINRPRLHHQLVPMEIEYEEGFPQSTIVSLRNRGHATTERGPTAGFAAVVAASRDAAGFYHGYTDRRRRGSVDGF